MTYSEAYTGDFILDIGVVIKELVLMVNTENKMDKNMERVPRSIRSLGLGSLGK